MVTNNAPGSGSGINSAPDSGFTIGGGSGGGCGIIEPAGSPNEPLHRVGGPGSVGAVDAADATGLLREGGI